MQIKSLLTAAVAVAWIVPGYFANAAIEHEQDAGAIFALQAATAENPEAKPAEMNAPETEQEAKTGTEKQAAVQTAMPVRSTRPRNYSHKDARACLDAGDNAAIIRCAEKYR